ncbi:hypothetical protein SAMD00019534_060190, partial [Acytostelium subglobosum LB1]|uniref:hypothetical protein n=1 Tax=Acytostelium subglobosum LB1 TaxID=1410327 RepID=UPI000644A83C
QQLQHITMSSVDEQQQQRILTLRVIKSFEYRTIKNILLRDVPLSMTVSDFKQHVRDKIKTTAGFVPFRNVELDTMKIYFIPHVQQKPNNLTINLDNDDNYILKDDLTLEQQGVVNETELSFFKLADYESFKKNPVDKW